MFPPLFIVAAGGLVRRENGDILLVEHPKRGWEFPGGQVENGETPVEGVLREILEETGVCAEVISFAGMTTNVTGDGVTRPQILNLDFVCRFVSGGERVSEEHRAIGWFPQEKALELVRAPFLLDRLRLMLAADGLHVRSFVKEPVYRVIHDAKLKQ